MSLSVWQVDPVHLTPYYNLTLGAALAQAGCEVHYVTSNFIYDAALLYPADIQTHFLYFPQTNQNKLLEYPSVRRILRTFLYPVGHRRLLQLIDEFSPSILHLQWSRLPCFDWWLINQLHQRKIPVVYTAHDVEPLFSNVSGLFEIYSIVDAIIVHAETNRDSLACHYPELSKKIHLIRHPAPEWPIPPDASRAMARAHLGFTGDTPILLFFGSNRLYKGLELLVEAFKRVIIIRPDLRLIVAGRLGNPRVLAPVPETKLFVEPEYVPSNLVWLYHLAADVAVFPYQQISQSGELITAMSFGLPVIVTDVGGMPETVRGNGCVVPPNDPVALAEAILDAFSDIPRLSARGSQSARLIRSAHSPALVAEQTLKLYNEIIE